MKKLELLVILGLAFSMYACKEGPAGPAGADGKDGKNGTSAFWSIEGFKDSLQCGTCHSADYDTTFFVAAKKVQYETSGHKELGDYDRNTTTCGGCHTNEGFVERYRNGFANETYTEGVASGPKITKDYPNSSPVGCFSCHLPHLRGNFSRRDTNSVNIFTLVAGQTTKSWNATSSSNLCVKCHQPRMTSTFLIPGSTPVSWKPDPTKTATTDTAKIYTTRWNNHVSGEQSQTLLGFGGFEFAGYTYANSYHNTAVAAKLIGCEKCHMATPIGNKGGGHTFKVGYIPEGATTTSYNFAGCNTTACHGTGGVTATNAKWKLVRDEIGSKISILGKLMMDTTITKKWSVPKSGLAYPWTTFTVSASGDTSWAVASQINGVNIGTTNPLRIVPAFKAGALWNLQQVFNERSKGIHNTAYVRALLDASIAELNK